MSKFIIIFTAVVLFFGVYSFANASLINLSGYIYSDSVGWISLNCSNTNSCSLIDYKASVNESGFLYGYGFSQTGEWVNLNPNYGGIAVDDNGYASGWAYSERSGWLNIYESKNISAIDLEKEFLSAKSVVLDDISSDGAINLINNLCYKLLSVNECNIISNLK